MLKQGIDSSQRGDGAEALYCLLQAQSLYRQMGDKRGEAAALGYLGTIYEYLGKSGKRSTLMNSPCRCCMLPGTRPPKPPC